MSLPLNGPNAPLPADCWSSPPTFPGDHTSYTGGTEISVSKPSFAIDRLAADCAPLQWLRELSHNGIQAVGKVEDGGVVVWARDEWTTYSDQYEASKLAVYDTGVGMTADELLELVGQSFSSGQVQSLTDNFGIGAKIAALPENPLGLVYTTLKDGLASRLVLRRNGSGSWERASGPSGNMAVWPVELSELPRPILELGHGTCVTLLGKTPESDTTRQPDSSSKTKEAWIVKYLNSRYFKLPDNVRIRAEVGGSDRPEVRGQRHFLDANAEARGTVDLKFDNFKAHWWVLSEEANKQFGGYARLGGHVAAILDDELYEMSPVGAQSASRLRDCGVTFGYQRVVIYFSNDEPRHLQSNTARTNLSTRDKQPYPWDELSIRFRGRLPEELRSHIDRSAPKYDASALNKRVDEELRDLFKRLGIGRYKPDTEGSTQIDENSSIRDGTPDHGRHSTDGERPSGGTGGSTGSGSNTEGSGGRGVLLPVLFPTVQWVSIAEGTREHGDIEDRAAHYDTASNTILINSDFRGFRSLESYWIERCSQDDTATSEIRRILQEVVAFMLIETVAAVLLLKKDKDRWDSQSIRLAHSDEALTAVSLQRLRIDSAVMKKLRTLSLL
jgi:hypothetical protein